MKKIFLVFLVIFAIQSCIPSIYPLYDKKSVTYDSSLEGTWQIDDEKWTFKEDQDKLGSFYKIEMMDEEGNVDIIGAHLVKVGGQLYFDFEPVEWPCEDDDSFLTFHFWPVHTFAKLIKTEKDKFDLRFFNYDHLFNLIKSGRIRLKHEIVSEDEIVLTASTKELQRFLEKYESDKNAFDDPTEFIRIDG